MHFIDSHVHLCEYQDYCSTLNFARSSSLMLLSSGVDMQTSLKTIQIAQEDPGLVRAFVGIHPSKAREGSDLEWFEGALRDATGAGELGLDPKYSDMAPHSAQLDSFSRQLHAVEKTGKPVQVHSRDAEKECLAVLGSYRLSPVLMHWFQGEAELREAGDRGYFISFGPALLHSKKLQRMASSLDPSCVMAESDGPVAFVPLGGAGGPSLIPAVVFKLAELWKKTFLETRMLLVNNGLTFLRESGKT